MAQRRYALVLSGGGFKGAFQEGALRYIADHWTTITGETGAMHFDVISGVSVGALNGALTAQNRLADLHVLWDQVERNGMAEIMASPHIRPDGHVRIDMAALKQALLPNFRVKAGMVLGGLWNGVRRVFDKGAPSVLDPIVRVAEEEFSRNIPYFKGLADANALVAKLDRYVSLGLFDPRTHFMCGLVSLTDGAYYALGPDDFLPGQDAELRKAILASAMMPIVWPPVRSIRTATGHVTQGVDGGLRNNSPLGDVFHHIQANSLRDVRVIVINCSSGAVQPLSTPEPSILRIALRSLAEVTLAEIFDNDIDTFQRINDLVRQASAQGATLARTRTVNGKPKEVPMVEYEAKIIQPMNDLGDTLDTRPEKIRERRKAGYDAAALAFADPGWMV